VSCTCCRACDRGQSRRTHRASDRRSLTSGVWAEEEGYGQEAQGRPEREPAPAVHRSDRTVSSVGPDPWVDWRPMTLSSADVARLLIALALLLSAAHGVGYVFVRLRQPRV